MDKGNKENRTDYNYIKFNFQYIHIIDIGLQFEKSLVL